VKFSSAYTLGTLIVVAVINLRFKVSVHALSASFVALCAPVVLDYPWAAVMLIPLALYVPWARVHHGRHSLMEADSGLNLELLAGGALCILLLR
jgi:hypothetical protein